MSETLLVTLITAGQAITLALIGLIGIRLGKVKTDVGRVQTDVGRVQKDAAAARTNSAAAREQVENNHDTNLREENDSRHAETKRWFDELRETVTDQFRTVTRDIGGIREEIRDDRRANRDRFTNIENRFKENP